MLATFAARQTVHKTEGEDVVVFSYNESHVERLT
jgi:hypothetical protein